MKVFNFETVIQDGRQKGLTVREAFDKNHNFVWQTIKRWATNGVKDSCFSDDVLAEANIGKIEHEHSVFQEGVRIDREIDTTKKKKLKKDNKTIDEIFDEMDDERYKSKKFDCDEKDTTIDNDLNVGFTIISEEE